MNECVMVTLVQQCSTAICGEEHAKLMHIVLPPLGLALAPWLAEPPPTTLPQPQ